MRKLSVKTSELLFFSLIGIFVIFIGLGLFLGTCNGAEKRTLSLVYGIISMGMLFLFRPYLTYFAEKTGKRCTFVLLVAVCLFCKLAVVLRVRVVPTVDYQTFYEFAKALSESFVSSAGLNRYVALFPHIFGYSQFLSLFFFVFKASVLVATFLNVILSVLQGILIYEITKLIIDFKAAVTAFALFIICPSQTLYNTLVLSEPLYTLLILLFVYVIVKIDKSEQKIGRKTVFKMSVIGLLCGLLLRYINMCRPIAIILIIALAIWIFLLRLPELGSKVFRQVWFSFIITVTVVFFVSGPLCNFWISKRIGEEPATTPGYSVYVGFNEKTNGSYSYEDAELLFSYSEKGTANWAQEQMKSEAEKRIMSGNIDFVNLFKEKIRTFLGNDQSAVQYINEHFKSPDDIAVICNTFYYMLLLLTVLGAFGAFGKYRSSVLSICILYVVGLILAQMSVEVAGRYHYSIIPFLIIAVQPIICRYEPIKPHSKSKDVFVLG